MRYVIKGTYKGRTEEVDSFDTEKEAIKMLAEYRMAFGAGWCLWVEEKEDSES